MKTSDEAFFAEIVSGWTVVNYFHKKAKSNVFVMTVEALAKALVIF